ncbi:unnamed protein product [Clonostachys solani]|uniref:Uncharacterized protein n=1 Tax=Clonostachys solani TaxID=160281 RepID=A0A9N9W9L7_9HYPO|nr:unnamed protein product [Clonostachys solani]
MEPKTPLTFNSLPTELRLKIWAEAIENVDGIAEAHFFRIGGSLRERKVAAAHQHALTNNDENIDNNRDLCPVHPPSWDPREIMCNSWVASENPSCYIANAGLWNTSFESREVLEKHYTRTDPSFHPSQLDNFHLMGESSFSSLLVNFVNDLHCFQVHGMDENTTMAITGRNMVPRHIAFEYKAEWGHPRFLESITSFFQSQRHYVDAGYSHRNALEEIFSVISKDKWSMSPGQRIWFIDYNIKATRKLKPEDLVGSHIFHANNRRLVEVGRCQYLVSRYRYPSTRARDGFVEYFRDVFLDQQFTAENQLPAPTAGVLACLSDSDFV